MKGETKNKGKDEKSQGNNLKAVQQKGGHAEGREKRGWSDIFDKLTYSRGPGDNIYVYG